MSSSTIERCSSGSITTSSAFSISSLLLTGPLWQTCERRPDPVRRRRLFARG
jgi:hypothetical protein